MLLSAAMHPGVSAAGRVMLSDETMTWGVLSLLAVHAAGLLLALRAMADSRTPQGSLAWMFALTLLPYVSIPLYFALGSRRFSGYVEARRRSSRCDSQLASVTALVQKRLAPLSWLLPPGRYERLRGLQNLVNLPICKGNSARLLVDGKETYDELIAAIREAKRYILFEFYIIKNDWAGSMIKNLLIERARTGVSVYVIYDEIGSHKLLPGHIRQMKKAGVRIVPFNGKRLFLTNIVRLNFRNHRKLVLADGRMAFVGGLNIGVDYLGQGHLGYWRDTFLRLSGPAVLEAQLSFLEDWHWATYGDIPELDWESAAAAAGDVPMMLLPSGPVDSLNVWQTALVLLAETAHKRLWLTTPYFVPSGVVANALQMAALRGVDVRILVPRKCDHRLVQLSSLTLLPELLPYGIGVYAYNKGFLHEKIALADDDICTVGTANLDNRSLSLNFELTALMCSEEMAGQVHEMLLRDFEHSVPLRPEDWESRSFVLKAAASFARLMAPVQ